MAKLDLEKKSKAELEKLLLETQVALREFRFGIAGSKVRNVKEGRNLRKTIARINTKLQSLIN